MRIVALLITVTGVAAFSPTFGVVSTTRSQTSLSAASTMKEVRKSIGKLDKDNMSTVLSDIEPFLLNNAGPSFYTKSMSRITGKAKALGADLPSGYAKAAKATAKRREKQDTYVKAKIAEAEEAAAAAAAEAAAATEGEAEAVAAE